MDIVQNTTPSQTYRATIVSSAPIIAAFTDVVDIAMSCGIPPEETITLIRHKRFPTPINQDAVGDAGPLDCLWMWDRVEGFLAKYSEARASEARRGPAAAKAD
ncbi:hypothetical protein [Methylobacterium sp. SD21]|uniref:hypothetical protein n=1 Tax=Methylobacterium litchii TaxID=3138810 RepID=UPI00313E3723